MTSEALATDRVDPTTDGPTSKAPALHVAMVEPEIPGNTGNLGRTCVSIGAKLHLIEPLGFDIDDRAVKRAGLDYWKYVDLEVWPSWDAFEPAIADLGEPWFFSAGAKRPLWDADFTSDSVLIFGCETQGLPQLIRDRYRDRMLEIPMNSPHIRSINVSNAASVAIFEAQRQRQALR